MATIESVSRETRVFEPPREFAAQANISKDPVRRAQRQRG